MSNLSKFLVPVLLVLGISFYLGNYLFLNRRPGLQNSVYTPKPTTTTAATPTPAATRKPLPSPEPKHTVSIFRKGVGKDDLLLSFDLQYRFYIQGWKNFLIFTKDQTVAYIHDTNSGETKTLFNMEEHKEFLKDPSLANYVYINNIDLIKDTLYINWGGYLAEVPVIWIDLNKPTETHKLSDFRNGDIEKFGDNYWLEGGEGDACWHYTLLSLLDTKKHSIVTTKKIDSGCDRGEYLLFVDNNRIVTLSYDRGENFGEPTYITLNEYRLSNLEKSISLVKFSDIKGNIKGYYYDKGTNKVFMYNNTDLYVFDFNINQLQWLGNTPFKINNIYGTLKDNQICAGLDGEEGIYLVSVNNTKITKSASTDCTKSFGDTSIRERTKEEMEGILDSLNMPQNYYYTID